MIKGILQTAASMVPRERMQEIIANNLANSETSGFKKDSIFLRLVKNQPQQTALNPNLNKLKPISPSWETRMIDKIYTDYSEGSLDSTGRDLDVAIQGDGFFAVDTPNGEAYTRNGALSISPSGQLVNADNHPILTDSGPVSIQGAGTITIGDSGQISVNGQSVGNLKIVNFEKPYNLQKISGSLYKPAPGVVPTVTTSAVVRQGYLERSNVDVLREMVDMIDSYRAFETGQRMIQIQDESLGKAVNDLPRAKV